MVVVGEIDPFDVWVTVINLVAWLITNVTSVFPAVYVAVAFVDALTTQLPGALNVITAVDESMVQPVVPAFTNE